MKKERKEELLHSFPPIPQEYMDKMIGKGARNFVALLTRGDELFARCYHRYSKGSIVERQRYVFAKDGSVRYGFAEEKGWTVRKEFTEPVFCAPAYGYAFDNSYTLLGFDAVGKSCMRYSQADKYKGSMLMEYLHLYCRHPNLEYLMKQGYDGVISENSSGYWGNIYKLYVDPRINWRSNDLLKMLGLSRTEFKLLRGNEDMYDCYCDWRERYPQLRPEETLRAARLFRSNHGLIDRAARKINAEEKTLVRYLLKQDCAIGEYCDYLDQCVRLKYDLSDPLVCFPRDLHAKHDELSEIERAIAREKQAEETRRLDRQLVKLTEKRRELEYASGDLILIQPESIRQIVDEGAALSHCVGGYASRHATGVLSIMFLRRADEQDKPYYTMEVSNDLRIVQCRGFKNNVEHRGGVPKAQEVIDFEKEYENHLQKLRMKRSKAKKKEAKSA